MTEITTVGGLMLSAAVVILTTMLIMLFSRCGSRDRSNNGDGSGDGVEAAVGGGLAIPNTSSIIMASSSSSTKSWKYDVFLSFRGEDTRKNFVDHLYHALDQHGIVTYKDDITLDRGDTIGPSLFKAIEVSQILVIIFSENYADSSWCLDELSHIMESKDSETGQVIFPIFFHVDPSDVRKQRGQFGKAFANAKHKLSKNDKEKVESWKKALVDAASIAGWEPKHVANGHEAKCIQEVVGSILVKLSSLDSTVEDEDLVGMRTRLKALKRLLRIGSGGVRLVGLWGFGGAGKTTLATSLYKELKISGRFHGCCFVENVREESKRHGLKRLQEKILSAIFNKEMKVESVDIGKQTTKGMLCRRNVLIVLDDVDHIDQLKALAGRHDWFGDGSRIIITTRNEQVLISHRVDEVYPVSSLSHDEATLLFNKHAYNEDNPLQDYEMLSQQIVFYADGLPLALIVLGSFLYDKDNDEWLDTLSRLKDHPEMDIVEKLRISYDGLKPVEKELFLDIACFHRWVSKDEVMKILDACGFYPTIGVKVLIQKALITISKEYGWFDMHDLVQEMAHYIVRGEHPKNPVKYSRVWQKEDIKDICSTISTMENNKIEAIQSDDFNDDLSFNFIMLVSKMKKLRFLNVSTTWFGGGPRFLSNELRYLSWSDYPASPFPKSFQPSKLVVLRMKGSLQKELWKGYKYLPCLKEMELCDMEALVRTPDFGGLPCLQKLIIEECENLEEIHQSLGNHSLVYLSVRSCKKLTRFPSIVRMDKLEILKIEDCEAFVEFPKIEAKMDSLIKLSSSYADLCMHQCLPCLKEMELYYMRALVRTPDFGGLPCLQKLKIVGCESLEEIHQSLGNHNSLVYLWVQSCKKLKRFPSIVRMDKLEILKIGNCEAFVEFTKIEAKMDSLIKLSLSSADLCMHECLPCLKEMELSHMRALVGTPDFSGLPCLQKLIIKECESLEEIHESLGNHNSLVHVHVEYCEKLTRFPSIVRMDKLEILEIEYCEALVEFPKIEAKMDKLTKLCLLSVGIEVLPSTIGEHCTNLTLLKLHSCSKLKSIEGSFHALKGLHIFQLNGCRQYEKIEKDIFNEKLDGLGLRKLVLTCCGFEDGEIPKVVGELPNLQELHLDMNPFTRLDFSLSRLTSLKVLELNYCRNLVELPELPSSLAILKADYCDSLEAIVKDDIPINCKCLCDVSIVEGRSNPIGGDWLLKTMLQGISVESGCKRLHLKGVQILSVFEHHLVRGQRCRMQLPKNWYHHFSGFLFFTASEGYSIGDPTISMKHEKSVGDSQDDDDDDDEVCWEEETDRSTWVGYLPFSLLGDTSWWDPTSTAVQLEFESKYAKIRKCGWKLVPKGGAASNVECSETTPTIHSYDDDDNDDDDYKCGFYILNDSMSAFNFKIHDIW